MNSDALGALLGIGVVLLMLLGTVLADRWDVWMRAHGLGWMMTGGRIYAVAFLWFFRACLVAIGVYLVVLFFENL